MANGTGLIEGVLLLAMGVPKEPGKGEPEFLTELSSGGRTDSCLAEARSFSGTVSPARHLDNSASYLQRAQEKKFVFAVEYHDFNSFIQR